jgi:hypothetical protein
METVAQNFMEKVAQWLGGEVNGVKLTSTAKTGATGVALQFGMRGDMDGDVDYLFRSAFEHMAEVGGGEGTEAWIKGYAFWAHGEIQGAAHEEKEEDKKEKAPENPVEYPALGGEEKEIGHPASGGEEEEKGWAGTVAEGDERGRWEALDKVIDELRSAQAATQRQVDETLAMEEPILEALGNWRKDFKEELMAQRKDDQKALSRVREELSVNTGQVQGLLEFSKAMALQVEELTEKVQEVQQVPTRVQTPARVLAHVGGGHGGRVCYRCRAPGHQVAQCPKPAAL